MPVCTSISVHNGDKVTHSQQYKMISCLGYGIAMPQGSPYRTLISGAVLKLQEEGRLHLLKTKWWKEKRGGGACRVC